MMFICCYGSYHFAEKESAKNKNITGFWTKFVFSILYAPAPFQKYRFGTGIG